MVSEAPSIYGQKISLTIDNREWFVRGRQLPTIHMQKPFKMTLTNLPSGRTSGRWNSTLRIVTSLESPEAGNPIFMTTPSMDISLKLKHLPST